jgi:PncC family amidohydrolase
MMNLCCEVLEALKGKTLVSAESCTGGGIGAALTAIPGSSAVYKGGVISYTNWVKANVLQVSPDLLDSCGAVSAPVAEAMAKGARKLLQADVAVSVTGLAGPGGDEFGNPVGTVYIGFAMEGRSSVKQFCFAGDRDAVRQDAIRAALLIVLENLCNDPKEEENEQTE